MALASERSAAQQDEPNPATSSTGWLRPAPGSFATGWPRGRLPAAAGTWVVPSSSGTWFREPSTKSTLVMTMTMAITSASASGAVGSQAGAGWWCRGRPGVGGGRSGAGTWGIAITVSHASGYGARAAAWAWAPRGRATAAVTPYQARALSRPASPASGTAAAPLTPPMRAAASDSTMNSVSSQPTAAAGGRVRHQPPARPAWLSGTAISSMAGSIARNGQENGTIATPKVRLTSGDITTHANVVTASARPNAAAGVGVVSLAGQASRTRIVF